MSGREHGLSVHSSAVRPLQIGVFIAAGELVLFVALVHGWQRRARILPWAVVMAGLAVSVAGNLKHVGWLAPVADKATAAALPPAAAAALAVGLGVLNRVVEHRPGLVYACSSVQVPSPAYTDAETAAIDALLRTTEAGNALTPKALQTKFRLTRAETTKVAAAVTAASNGQAPPIGPGRGARPEQGPPAAGPPSRRKEHQNVIRTDRRQRRRPSRPAARGRNRM